jgi:hypothetical protein
MDSKRAVGLQYRIALMNAAFLFCIDGRRRCDGASFIKEISTTPIVSRTASLSSLSTSPRQLYPQKSPLKG